MTSSKPQSKKALTSKHVKPSSASLPKLLDVFGAKQGPRSGPVREGMKLTPVRQQKRVVKFKRPEYGKESKGSTGASATLGEVESLNDSSDHGQKSSSSREPYEVAMKDGISLPESRSKHRRSHRLMKKPLSAIPSNVQSNKSHVEPAKFTRITRAVSDSPNTLISQEESPMPAPVEAAQVPQGTIEQLCDPINGEKARDEMRVGETDRAAAMNEDVERQQANDQSFSPDHQNAIGHEEKKKLTQLEATLLVKIELGIDAKGNAEGQIDRKAQEECVQGAEDLKAETSARDPVGSFLELHCM
ncbi:hypothetical protein MMC20_001658 [Loxospora ochrophaea]|nr:hypothetical protein [Loxospora ochrophaea]